jgi:hypothetical protein
VDTALARRNRFGSALGCFDQGRMVVVIYGGNSWRYPGGVAPRLERPTLDDLRAIQRQRERPTRLTQRSETFVLDRVIGRVLGSSGTIKPPWILRVPKRRPLTPSLSPLRGAPATA